MRGRFAFTAVRLFRAPLRSLNTTL
ncbi:hypothetical protein SAM23877_3648 [Streptomyces ambofaciens ATCC 23877]|uniref:Uncharacterized protein n=1 Tax=Streptomyces ambofaciens (strain ATCC 23877 / 3486 / DSM 40053 / JCM 4204 / NBRC 12836 / NRRL B-2516) TaxID=278992 RepID=A0A0K2AUM4_STRA7|nr:hypothetical protein SAM23877_3648 [Streptomyces ambofaciens ATCC 23877]